MCTVCSKCISICEMLFLACTEHTSTMSPELMKLRIMTISTKTKVAIIFGTSAMMCVELRAKKCALSSVHVKCSSSHVQNTLQPYRQSMKLRIMIISIKIKVLIKFETSETMCAELSAKNL